jgi:ribose/xylose/arabinose/galactoside ABC-type transport system permease subunit
MSVQATAPSAHARPPGPSSSAGSGRAGTIVRHLLSSSTLIGMLAVLVVIQFLRPAFLSWGNLNGVLIQSSVLIVLAVGLAVVMSMRGLDLSIAQTADLAGYVAATMVLSGGNVLVVIIVAVLIGLAAGGINGVLSAYLGVPAIVSTLGLSFILQAVELVVSDNGKPQQLFSAPSEVTGNFLLIGEGLVNGIPLLIIIAAVIAVVLWVVTRRTVMGRYGEALEMNANAAYLAGVPVRRVYWSGFAISGAMAGLAGVMLVSRSGIAAPGAVQPYLLDAFTAVYLGAMASPRPVVRVSWTVVGAVFVSLLANGLTLLGLGAPYRYGLNGLLILLALALGVTRRR